MSIEVLVSGTVLLYCLLLLGKTPAWWRGEWSPSPVRWRDRAWLATVLFVTVLSALMLVLFGFDLDNLSTGEVAGPVAVHPHRPAGAHRPVGRRGTRLRLPGASPAAYHRTWRSRVAEPRRTPGAGPAETPAGP